MLRGQCWVVVIVSHTDVLNKTARVSVTDIGSRSLLVNDLVLVQDYVLNCRYKTLTGERRRDRERSLFMVFSVLLRSHYYYKSNSHP